LLDQRVVTAFDAAKAWVSSGAGLFHSS
jgi:hypothetical protein